MRLGQAKLPLDPGLVKYFEHRQIGGAARVNHRLRLDDLAPFEFERVAANCDDAGTEPILFGLEHGDEGAMQRFGAESRQACLQVPGLARARKSRAPMLDDVMTAPAPPRRQFIVEK